MSEIVMPAFCQATAEAAIIGRLMAGYGELEFEMAQCLARVPAVGDLRSALKIFFEPKIGEKDRISIARKHMIQNYGHLGLRDAVEQALEAINHCRVIRNEFAHCHWAIHKDVLFYVSLSRTMKAKVPDPQLDPLPLDLQILGIQERYFYYAAQCFAYSYHEHDRQCQKIRQNPFLLPAKRETPSLHSPVDRYERPHLIDI